MKEGLEFNEKVQHISVPFSPLPHSFSFSLSTKSITENRRELVIMLKEFVDNLLAITKELVFLSLPLSLYLLVFFIHSEILVMAHDLFGSI